MTGPNRTRDRSHALAYGLRLSAPRATAETLAFYSLLDEVTQEITSRQKETRDKAKRLSGCGAGSVEHFLDTPGATHSFSSSSRGFGYHGRSP